MPPPATVASKPRKPRPNKKSKEQQQKKKAASLPTFKDRVLVRKLPAALPEAIFWNSVLPWVHDDTTEGQAPTVDQKQYIAGKVKSDAHKHDRPSRAYIRFLDAASLVAFHKAFDGHIFRDSKGNESVAIVEFAPSQKSVAAKTKSKVDPKQGTIDTDADYLAFVAKLKQEEQATVEKKSDTELLAHLLSGKEKEQADAAAKTTPLLEFLRAAKTAKLEAAAAAKKAKKAQDKAAAAAAAPPTATKGKKADKTSKSSNTERKPTAAAAPPPPQPKSSNKEAQPNKAAKAAGKKKPIKPKPKPDSTTSTPRSSGKPT